jgi:hypothetical protein
MKSLLSRLPYLVLPAIVVCSVDPAFADGKFFRRLEVADEPGIQAQRAVVAFKDGIETLIVQSDVDGEGTSYGWLLPLPAEPTAIAPCEANSLNALSSVIRPKIAGTPKPLLVFSLVLMLVMVAACLEHLRRRNREGGRASAARILLGIVAASLLVSVFLPSLSRHRGVPSGVEVLQASKAGVYDVTIIKGQTGEEVASWLTSNGFACPPSATTAIREYVSDDWCFLAAMVSPDAEGPATHHPLIITFPASRAVYPLRLTGVDGDPIQLDLYVIAERRAAARSMDTWLCHSYTADTDYNPFGEYVSDVPPIYRVRNTPIRVGIPAISELMWPGCVLTRLHARLDAADMASDLSLTWLNPEPTRVTLHSQRDAIGWSVSIAAIAVALWFAWCTRVASAKGWSPRELVRRRLVSAILMGLVVGVAWYTTLDVVSMKEKGRSRYRELVAAYAHEEALRQLSEGPPGSDFPKVYRNLLSRSRLDEANSPEKPGDYKIETVEDGWQLTIIDRFYIPVAIHISSSGMPKSATE